MAQPASRTKAQSVRAGKVFIAREAAMNLGLPAYYASAAGPLEKETGPFQNPPRNGGAGFAGGQIG